MNWWTGEDPVADRHESGEASDNEYLHYINFKLGYTNTLLKRIAGLLALIAVATIALAFALVF